MKENCRSFQYLTELFFFPRFYGRIAEGPNNFDEATIEAIKANVDGLQKISGERIWGEVKKTLQGNFRIDILAKMIECGASRYIGEDFRDFLWFAALIQRNCYLRQAYRLKQTPPTCFR